MIMTQTLNFCFNSISGKKGTTYITYFSKSLNEVFKKFPFYDILIVKVQADFIHINIFVKVRQSKKNQCMNIKKIIFHT